MSKTMLMIHGVGCGGEVWDPMKTGFEAAGWRCEAPTLFPQFRTVESPPEGLADLTLDDYVEAMGAKARQGTCSPMTSSARVIQSRG